MEAAIYAMARLCLRQETELSELRQEKSFLLHVSAGPHGILKPLIQASVKWNELRDQMKVDCSLKSELFRMMLKETAARMEKFEQTPDSIAAAEKAGGQLGHNSAPDVALPEVGPGCTPSHPRSKPSGYRPSGSQGPAGVHERGTEARSGGPQSVHAKEEAGRDHEWSLCGVHGGSGVSEHPVPDPVRCLCEAGRAVSLAADRRQHAQGEAEAWPRSGGGPQPDVALRLRLRNPSATNSCYINSTFLTLVHAWTQGGSLPGVLGTLGIRLQALLHTARPVALRDLPIVQAVLRLWAHPNRQHDIAEFFSHFVSFYRMPFGQECWQARDIRGPALHVLDEGTLQTPIPLHIPASRVHGQPCAFQDCVDKFFRDHSCGCALASAAPLLCFQLKRYEFHVRTGAVSKLVTPVSFTEPSLQVPIWEDVSAQGPSKCATELVQ